MKTLEDLLRMEVMGTSGVTGQPVSFWPDFRVAVQSKTEAGVHVIIHAAGYNSDTLDLLVKGNNIEVLYNE